MICASCGNETSYGFFTETKDGSVSYICGECLVSYDNYRKIRKKHKYDHLAIYAMHKEGFCDKTIATHFGTNPLTVGRIIENIERGRE